MTTVISISMVRDEADVIEATVRQMLTQVDHVIVADNGSIDGTREILDRLPVEVIDDPEVGYFQSRKMTALAARACGMGADWIVPFDADECWYSPFGRIADVLDTVPRGATSAGAELYDHVATALDPDDPNPLTRIKWRRRHPAPLPKVAFRRGPGLVVHQGNHGVSHRYGESTPHPGLLVVRHFPMRSVAQAVSKARNGAAAYAATDLPEDFGAHWRSWGRMLADHGEEAIGDLFRKWYWRAHPTEPIVIEGEAQDSLIFDPAPCAST